MKKYLIGFLAVFTLMACGKQDEGSGYIGPSEVNIENGVMTPEVLLSLGRLSDPQLSPDGSHVLYGVSWTDIAANRSCRNLWLCKPDGSGSVQLTRYVKSVSNARWSLDGKSIFFPTGGYKHGFNTYDAGHDGYYWSSTLDQQSPDDAWFVHFGNGKPELYGYYRSQGRSIRPVLRKTDQSLKR